MILEVSWDGLWTLSFGLSQFHGLTALGSCVKWPRDLGPGTSCEAAPKTEQKQSDARRKYNFHCCGFVIAKLVDGDHRGTGPCSLASFREAGAGPGRLPRSVDAGRLGKLRSN